MSTKIVVEVAGIDIDNGNDSVQNIKLPTQDDWKRNLAVLQKKIAKKFEVAEEYGLTVNESVIRFDDVERLETAFDGFDFANDTAHFEIVDIATVDGSEGRSVTVHYGDKQFVFSVPQELSQLDEDVYDDLLDQTKTYFKIRGRLGKIYEDVGGKPVFVDDWDDLSECLEDKEDNETLHVYLQDKNAQKSAKKLPVKSPKKSPAKSPPKNKTKSTKKKNVKKLSDLDFEDEKKEEKKVQLPDREIFSAGFHHIKCTRVRYSMQAMKGSQKVFSTGSNKIIMVVGQTGAGKTTFLNSMVNYIYGVQFEDEFRLKLIIEQDKKGGQAVSQTDDVSAYFIKRPLGSKLHYDLTVVDTPGFGDTRGMEQDRRIVKNIKLFFENVLDSIDAVCFVVKATETRLTGSQKYIFNSVLNLWGKNVKENIFILMTFADAEDPPVLDAIREQGTVADCKYYKLNNSVYKKDPRRMNKTNKQAVVFDKMFWDMGTMCFDSLFTGLSEVSTKSVAFSREVLRKREAITTQIELMSAELEIALSEQQELEKQKKYVTDHKQEINSYAEKPYYETKYYFVRENRNSTIITTCTVCANKSCHPGCCVTENENCGMMGEGGYCEVCDCHWSKHENRSYEYVKKSKRVRKSDWEDTPTKKQKYQAAQGKLSRSQIIIQNKQDALKNKQKKVTGIIGFIHTCIRKLEKIALRPSVTTVGDYIDKLIDAEESNPKGRDQRKIKKLKAYKKQEKYILKIQTSESCNISELLDNK